MKSLKVIVIFVVTLIVGSCSKEPTAPINSEMTSMLCSNEWVEFKNGSYNVYSFKLDGAVRISKYDKAGLYKEENYSYMFSGSTLSLVNEYGVRSDYDVQLNESRYIQFKKANDTLTLYAVLANQKMLAMLTGTWEYYDSDISWFKSYSFDSNYSFTQEQIINFALDKTESGSGSFKLDKIWIELDGPNKIKLKTLWYIDTNGDLIFQDLLSGVTSKYTRVNSKDESLRPPLAKDSPLYKTLTTGSWVLFDKNFKDKDSGKYMSGFEIMTFADGNCKSAMIFKNKKYYSGPHDNVFVFNPETNIVKVLGNYLMDTSSNDRVVLKNTILGDTWIHYDDKFVEKIMGRWTSGELVYEFGENNHYTITVYKDSTLEKVEEVFSGNYTIEPCFITLSPMPSGFITNADYFHFQPGDDDNTLYIYFPDKTDRITLKRKV